MSSIRWIRNVLVDGVPTNLSSDAIADKCYVRANTESKYFFKPAVDSPYNWSRLIHSIIK